MNCLVSDSFPFPRKLVFRFEKYSEETPAFLSSLSAIFREKGTSVRVEPQHLFLLQKACFVPPARILL